MKNITKKIFLMTTVFLAAATFSQAALPPFYESVKEFKALLNNSELNARLGPGDMINDIKRDDKGFVVTTNHHVLKVDVVYEATPGVAGPAKFHLDFHEAENT